jgi:hypothetical protein
MENFIQEPSDKETVDVLRHASKLSPKESLTTIRRAGQQGLHPDEYSKNQADMDAEVEIQERTPAQVNPAIKNYDKRSSHHANSTKEEKSVLSKIADMASYTWYNLSGQKNEIEDEIQNLQYKGRQSENGLDDNDKATLSGLQELQQEEIAEFGLSGMESVPGQVGAVVNDMFNAVENNKTIITAATLAGASIGIATPLLGTGPIGASTGFGIGVSTAMAVDAYYKTANSTWGDIQNMKNDDGTPLNLPHSTAQNISIGVGVFSGLLEAVTGKVLTGGATKLLGKSAGSNISRAVVKNVKLKAKMDIFGHVVKSSGVSSIEEISADLVARAGEHVARGKDTSAEGIANAIAKTTDDVLNDSEFRKQLGMTGLVGGIASGAISSTTSALTYGGIKKNIERQNLTVEETLQQQEHARVLEGSIKALESQDAFVSMSRLAMETEFKKLSPVEMTELRKEMFAEAGYTDKIWFNDADVQIIEGVNPELADKLKALDVSESAKNNTGAPIAINPYNFADLIEEAPTISEYARNNPEAPNPLESKALLARLQDNQDKKTAILESLAENALTSPFLWMSNPEQGVCKLTTIHISILNQLIKILMKLTTK